MNPNSVVTTSAFTRVSNTVVGVVPNTASLGNIRDEATPTPVSSTTSDSPSTLRRPPFGSDEDDENDPDASSNQGDNAFAWPTHNSYDEQRYLILKYISLNHKKEICLFMI